MLSHPIDRLPIPSREPHPSSSLHSHFPPPKRFHLSMKSRHCRFSDSASPSPPATVHDIFTNILDYCPIPIKADRFSSLPQELIEEIGLLACLPPFPQDTPSPFSTSRHRLRTLRTLTLLSKQFHQIFTRALYREPLLIDTQHAKSLSLPNTANAWVNGPCYEKAPLARKFTLWRPRSEELLLYPVNPFVIVFMLTNVRELTLSGNFGGLSPTQQATCFGGTWIDSTLVPKYVPHLHSIRLIDIDDAESLNGLLMGIAHNITSLVVSPSSQGRSNETYFPRSLYTTLRPLLESMSSLLYLDVSLPPSKPGLINHCNHAHKLISKNLTALPSKEKLRSLIISLPVFDCRLIWIDGTEEEDDEGRTIDHAWFWSSLQNYLTECPNLKSFKFTGSLPPSELETRLRSSCRGAKMDFAKQEKVELEEFIPPTSTNTAPSSNVPTTQFQTFPLAYQTPSYTQPTPVTSAIYPFTQPVDTSPSGLPDGPTTWSPLPDPYPPPLLPHAALQNPFNDLSYYPLPMHIPHVSPTWLTVPTFPTTTAINPLPQPVMNAPVLPEFLETPTAQVVTRGVVQGLILTTEVLEQRQEWDWHIKYD